MATADRDGRIAQAFSDAHTCLVMAIYESIREGTERLNDALDQITRKAD